MIVNFNEDYLRDLYRSGKSDKKHRFQPQIVRKYIRVIDLMVSEDNVQGLWKYNSPQIRNRPHKMTQRSKR